MKRFEIITSLIKGVKNPVGAEIGVCNGVFTEYMLTHNPALVLYAVDPFIMYQKQYESGVVQHGFSTQNEFDEQFKSTKAKLAKFIDRCVLLRTLSAEAVNVIKNNSLDFVFIDGNHLYNYVKADIISYYDKVKNGGILAGHDYNPNDINHLTNTCRAVNEVFTKEDVTTGDDSTWWIKKGN